MINFCFDLLTRENIGFPNLAQHQALPFSQEWRQFDHHWPHTVPLRLLLYLQWAGIEHESISIDCDFDFAWYPIGIGWFDLSLDYFSLVSETAIELAKQGRIKILFYYHEGDNPMRIKEHIDQLVVKHDLPKDCYLFLTANTSGKFLENFRYFPDHEFFFRYINRKQLADSDLGRKRPYKFTILNRTHKWWRASCMSDLKNQGILEHSLWSYNTADNHDHDLDSNPLELDLVEGWRQRTIDFVAQGPKLCDNYDHLQQNNHHFVNINLYRQSWCHIIFETHYDADQSMGTFLTEKTFKCLKFGQPFVLVGPPGSLEELRGMGYKTFDRVIDNKYDTILDNTERWKAILKTIMEISNNPHLQAWHARCQADLYHNQEMFVSRLKTPLNIIAKELQCH